MIYATLFGLGALLIGLLVWLASSKATAQLEAKVAEKNTKEAQDANKIDEVVHVLPDDKLADELYNMDRR